MRKRQHSIHIYTTCQIYAAHLEWIAHTNSQKTQHEITNIMQHKGFFKAGMSQYVTKIVKFLDTIS